VAGPSRRSPHHALAAAVAAALTACAGGAGPAEAPTLASLAIGPSPLTLAPGETRALLVTGTLSDGSSAPLTAGLTFESADPAVATVGAGGVVTGVAAGATTVSAAAAGRRATAEVTVSGAAAHDPGPGWTLAWSDEFDGTAVDPSSWTFDLGSGGWGNGESQWYRAENAVVAGGLLTITAKVEPFGDAPYTSARLQTSRKRAFTYGTFAVRARLPGTQGMWPAFWLLGANSASFDLYGGDVAWPGCGEIDAMELIGGLADGSGDFTTHGTLHYLDATGRNPGPSYALRLPRRLSEDFHVYEVVWTPRSFTWKVDGLAYGTKVVTADMEEFSKPMFILLNLAVGGAWGGWPDASTVFPQRYEIDWVRVYQQDGAAPGDAPGLPTAWHLSSVASSGVAPAGEALSSAPGTVSGFQPLKVLAAPATWWSAPLTGTYDAGAWSVGLFTTSPAGAAPVRVEAWKTAADGSAAVRLGAAEVDVRATGGGNHRSWFTLTGVPATAFAGERIKLTVTPLGGAEVTLIYNGNDFDSLVTTPWSAAGP